MFTNWNNWVKGNYQKVLGVSAAVFSFLWSVDTINAKYINPPLDRNKELIAAVARMPLVNSELHKILERSGAGRVVVFRVYSAYLDKDRAIQVPGSMTKTSIYSITADSAVASNGVLMALPQITRLPGALMSPVLDLITDTPNRALFIVTEELPNTALKELFEQRSTVESLWIAIPNSKTDFAGILQVDWQHDLDCDHKERIAQELPSYSRSLGRYL